MEIIHVWALAAALGAAALAATLKAVEYRHELKLSNKEVARLGKEMDVLKQNTNERISDLEKLHSAEKEELSKRISDIEKQIKLHNQQPPSEPWEPLNTTFGY